MGKLRAFLDTFNSLAGISAQHNKALRDVKDWAENLQKFLSAYNLDERAIFNSLVERVGEVKVELVTLTHRARTLTKTAKNIKGKKVSPIIKEIITSLETLRVTLINPHMYDEMLSKDILILYTSYKKLQNTLSEIERL
jgi:hypothetical protein